MVTMTQRLLRLGLTLALLFTLVFQFSLLPASADEPALPAIGLPLEGLEAWYKLDEEEGSTTAADSSGNEHHAVAASGTWQPDGGVDGGAIALNGTNQMIQLNGTTGSTFLKNAFSVHSAALWFKADDTASRQVLYERGGNAAGLALQLNGNKLEAAVVNASVMNVVSIDFTDTTTWHHVVVSFDNGALKLYLDGQLVGEKAAGYTTVSSALNEAAIGARYGVDAFGGSKGGAWFHGMIDDVRLYTTAVVPSAEAIGVTGVSLNHSILTMAVGESSTLTAKVEPLLASNKNVTWASSNPDVATVTPNGMLKASVEAKSEGTATITVTTEDGSFTAASTAHVNPVVDDGKAFLMSYFRSDVAQTGQRDQDLHFSYSRDGVKWYEFNNNLPVFNFTDELRDPFVAKGKDGVWRLLFTSPQLNSDGSNGPANDLGYAESRDLVHWTNIKRLDVMKAFKDQGIYVHNSWAPEWSYDPVNDEYVIYWSSTLVNHAPDDNKHYYLTTKDWETFTDAKLLFDPGHKTIDANLYSIDADYEINGQSVRDRLGIPADQQIPGNLVWFMFYKDETPATEGGMRTRQTWSAKGITDTASYQDPSHISDYVTPSKTEGPTVFKVGNKWNLIYDYWWAGKFGLESSADLTDPTSWSDEVMDLRIPYRARHSGMTMIDNAETWNLINNYSLEASYPFNGNAADSSGHGYDGEIIGQPSIVSLNEGNSGYASFDGSHDAIKLDHLRNSFYIRSVSMWVKAGETDRAQMLYNEGNKANGGLALKIEGNELIAGVSKDDVLQTVSTAFNDTDWHHVAVIYEEGMIKLYVDGVEKGKLDTGFQPKQSTLNQNGEAPQSRNPELYDIETASNTAMLGVGTENDVFGTASTDAYFNGVMGQIELFTIPLFSRDVNDLYQADKETYDFEPGVEKSGAILSGASEAAPGDEFAVTYGLAGMEQEVFAQDVTLTYDADMLDFVSAVSLNDNFVIAGKAESTGQVRIIGANVGSDHQANGDWLKLTFRAKSEQSSSTAITVGVVAADQQGVETEVSGAVHHVQINAVNKASLIALIAEAQSKHDAAVEGTKPGQYPAGAKAALQAAIDEAKAVADNEEATQADVEQALADLTNALQTFMNSVHVSDPEDTNGDGSSSVGDLGVVAHAYGKTSADADWAQFKNADVTGDGKVDIEDLAAVARKILE